MKMLHKLLKLGKKKTKGQADLIASIFTIAALAVFVVYFINVIGDVTTRIQLDQIARKYILYMESAGELTPENEAGIYAELNDLAAVKKAKELGGGDPVVSWETSSGVSSKSGYGGTITLTLKCPVATTGYNLGVSMYGVIGRNSIRTYVITKSSTAKY